ncbi:hypothetical protein ACB094_01G274900 [Castanea mollissima]
MFEIFFSLSFFLFLLFLAPGNDDNDDALRFVVGVGVGESKREDGVGTMMAIEKIGRGHDDCCWVWALKERQKIVKVVCALSLSLLLFLSLCVRERKRERERERQ